MVGPVSNHPLSPLLSPLTPQSREATQLASQPLSWRKPQVRGSLCYHSNTSLLTKAAGNGGPMAPNTQMQVAGPPGRPGLWAGSTCSPRSLGLLGTMFFMRKGFPEVGLFLLGFLPAGGAQVFYNHLWLLVLKLLWTRWEKRSVRALGFEDISRELGKEISVS